MKQSLVILLLVSLFCFPAFPQERISEEENTEQSPGEVGRGVSTISDATHPQFIEDSENSGIANKISLNYFGLFFGPSVQSPSSYQPGVDGLPDRDMPVHFKNFLGLGYNLTDEIAISGTFFWTWQPVLDHDAQVQDPFLKVSHNSIFFVDGLNLYGDLRFHIPASNWARNSDFQLGVQTVQALSYAFSDTNLLLGLVGSARVNRFGQYGFGNDLEFYLAPNLNYQFTDTLAFTVLYEMMSVHSYGEAPFSFQGNGTDLETGFAWDITSQLTFNPYLHFPISGNLKFNATSFGMMINWAMI